MSNNSIAQDKYIQMAGYDLSTGKHNSCWKKYLKKDYNVAQDSIKLDKSYVKFFVFSPIKSSNNKDLWILQTNRKVKVDYNPDTIKNKIVLAEPVFLGSVDKNGEIYFPKFQPYGDTLILVFTGKRIQKVMLFNNWDSEIFDGNKIFFCDESLDLYSKNDNSDFVYKFNKKLKKVIKLKHMPNDINLRLYEFTNDEKL